MTHGPSGVHGRCVHSLNEHPEGRNLSAGRISQRARPLPAKPLRELVEPMRIELTTYAL